MEHLYEEVIRHLRELVDKSRIDREEDESKNFLENIIKRLNFISDQDDDEYIAMKRRLILEMKRFAKKMFTYKQDVESNKNHMQRNIDNLAWLNRKDKINKRGRGFTVAQREIYYAELGTNIGSEQNGERPVIILQNDKGNRAAHTTVIAPVTTHGSHGDGTIKYDPERKKYYIQREIEGKVSEKVLDFYEVPLYIEGKREIYGFVNVTQLRAIDRKRIHRNCNATVTQKCFNRIIEAIEKNFKN